MSSSRVMRARILPVFVLLACADGGMTSPEEPPPLRALAPMDRSALMTQIGRLAHDTMNGRGSGTTDEVRAASYIGAQFQAAGLQPAAGAWLMQFVIPPSRVQGRTDVTSQNVIGTIPGAGSLQHEWIVLGAHYDHVGKRPNAAGVLSVFNGADDNASGTALIIEVAKYLSSYIATGGTGSRARRSIMFQAFGAEELGLIGSEAYCSQPIYPLVNVAAMLNFDMVGRLTNRNLSIGGIPTAAEWQPMITQHNQDQLVITQTDCSGCTDFACFRRNQRPVLWLFTGLHADYHRDTDDTELINADGLGQVADLALRLTVDLTVAPRAPVFRSPTQ